MQHSSTREPAAAAFAVRRPKQARTLCSLFGDFSRLTAALLFLAASAPALATDFYVSPSGSGGGDGSAARPWNLATALAHPAAVRPGDTIWLRGGIYRGVFVSNLNGTAGAPIKVRQYPGERATLDGGNSNRVNILTVGGSHTWYWGFEVMSSDPARVSSQAGPSVSDLGRGGGIATAQPATGAGLKLINLIVHDTASGIALWTEALGAEVYGCLIYYNGWSGADRPHGHGIYMQNLTGTKRILDNIIFSQFSHGIQAFGSGAASLDNFHIEGNTVFSNGPPNNYQRNILVGGGTIAHNLALLNNSLYYPGAPGQNLNVGYTPPDGAGVSGATIIGNYIVNGDNLFSPNNTQVTMSGNFFYSTLYGGIASQFPSNTYASSRPTGVRVIVRPNAYEPGRAHVTVHNWDGVPSVAVNLSSVLPAGALYEIRNAQNVFGSPVASGTYSGSPITLPMGGLAPASPVGYGAPAPTGPLFNTFIVTTRGVAPPTPAPPPPTPTATAPPPPQPTPTPPPGQPTPTPPPGQPTPTPPPAPPGPNPTPSPNPPPNPTSTPVPGQPTLPPTTPPWVLPTFPPAPGPGPSSARPLTVPVAGHVTGAGGIVFVTDLHIENPTGAAGSATLSFLPSGSASSSQVSLSLSAGQTLNYYDVIGVRFGISNAVGALRLENSESSSVPFRMTSRTYARVGAGTFGQAVSGVDWEETSDPRFVTGLVATSEYRTNVGAVNVSPWTQRFVVTLYASNGYVLGVTPTLELAPGHQMQWSLAGLFPAANGKGLTAEFRPLAGSMTPTAYGAVVDNQSGDPTYYAAIRPRPTVYLPGVAHVTGLGLTTFTSDVSFANPTSEPVTVTVTFLERLRDNTTAPSVTFTLPPRSTRQVDDALPDLFGITETYGALKVECPAGSGILVAERIQTASLTGAGTVGQQVDPISPSQLMTHGSVLGLRHDNDFRSNVGLFNPNPYPVNVDLVLKVGPGNVIAGTTLTLLPQSYEQRGLGSLFPGTALPAAQSLTIVVNSGAAPIFPFGIVVDNQSQDLTFAPGLR